MTVKEEEATLVDYFVVTGYDPQIGLVVSYLTFLHKPQTYINTKRLEISSNIFFSITLVDKRFK